MYMYNMYSSFQLSNRIPLTLPILGTHNIIEPVKKYMSDGNDSRFLNDTDDDFKYKICRYMYLHKAYTYLQMTEFNDISKATWALYVLETLCDMNSISIFNVLKGGLLGDEWSIDESGNLF